MAPPEAGACIWIAAGGSENSRSSAIATVADLTEEEKISRKAKRIYVLTTTVGGIAPFYMGIWGGVDLIRDQFTKAGSG